MGTSNAMFGLDIWYQGSSPRVWGQVIVAMATLACGQDHPHAYGDKAGDVPEEINEKGSSPRVWGQVS